MGSADCYIYFAGMAVENVCYEMPDTAFSTKSPTSTPHVMMIAYDSIGYRLKIEAMQRLLVLRRHVLMFLSIVVVRQERSWETTIKKIVST